MPSSRLSPTSTSTVELDVLGVQQPRVHSAPPYARSLGRQVIDFMDHVGKPLDPWQQLMVMDTFGLRDDGYWAAFECVGLVPRQNGKGGYTEAVELAGLFLFGDQIIMHSAHLFKTAKQSFQRIMNIVDGSDWLTKRVHKVTRARGDEEIELTKAAGGGRLMCFSRAGGSGRGFTGDKTVFDECAYLSIEQYQAATPTLATVPNPQIIYTGTPPDEDTGPMPEDAMMPSVRQRGHRGGDRIALWEWSPPETYDRTNPALWAACNPSLGDRIQTWFLAKQLDNFTEAGKPEKFDTEHLGVWPDYETPEWVVFSRDDWRDCKDDESAPKDPVAFAVVTAEDSSWSTICVAGQRADGVHHVEVAERQPGTAWVVPWVIQRVADWKPCSIVINKSTPAGQFVAPLTEAGVEITPISTQDAAAASGALLTAVMSKTVRHRGQGALNVSIAKAAKREFSKTWELALTSGSTDVSPAPGCAYALWGYTTRPPADQPFFAAWR